MVIDDLHETAFRIFLELVLTDNPYQFTPEEFAKEAYRLAQIFIDERNKYVDCANTSITNLS